MSPKDDRERRELRLLRRYHDHQDLSARDELVELGLPLVRSLARPYAGRSEPFDDLVQVGCVGLLKAIDRFDPHAGHRFVSFAVPNITGEIKRHFRDHGWMVHLPRPVQELEAKVQQARGQIAAEDGVTPTPRRLAERLGEPLDRVEEAIQGAHAYRALSLDHPLGDSGSALDTIGSSEVGYLRAEQRLLVREGYQALDAREREIVWMRYHEDRLQREIAARIGVSQMQVSRLLQRAVTRMREQLEPGPARRSSAARRSGACPPERAPSQRAAVS